MGVPRITLDMGSTLEYERRARGEQFIPEHVKNQLLNEVDTQIAASERRLELRMKAILGASGEGAPPYVLAIYSTGDGKPSGRTDRPHWWQLDTGTFGTLLYCHLRGRRGKKRLAMNSVCDQWIGRDGQPMNYRSILTMHSEGRLSDRLPDPLASALATAGYPFNPPAERLARAHALKTPKM